MDLNILVFLLGFLFARISFAIANWPLLGELSKVVMLNRYPGLSFWGGFFVGFLALWVLVKRSKFKFWQIADFAAVGFLIGSVFGDVGCFLGGCGYGTVSNSVIAAPVVGLLGKRFPISLFESLAFFISFVYLWGQVVRFHFAGKIASIFLIIFGMIKFVTEFYRGDSRPIISGLWFSYGHLYSLITLIGGISLFYILSKRSFKADLIILPYFLFTPKGWGLLLSSFQKTCYNNLLNFRIKTKKKFNNLGFVSRKLRRRLNVKPTPTNIS